MNENEKQAFGEWVAKDTAELEYKPKELSWALLAWEAACAYKNKEYSNLMDAMTQTSQNNARLKEMLK